MLFRNLVLYRLPADFSISAFDLEEALAQRPLRPCGGFEMQTRGWIPCGDTGRLAYPQGQHILFTLGMEQKILPASVIREETRQRAAGLAESQGHPVGRRQMRELKARVTDELRARALVRRRSTLAWFDLGNRRLVVDCASATRAEELLEVLRDTLETLAVQPLECSRTPAEAMAAWLGDGDVPGRFLLGDDLELTAADNSGATVRWAHHPLDAGEVRAHLGAGKVPTRLGLSWNDRIAFVLDKALQVKRIQFLDVQKDDRAQGESAAEQYDIDVALATGELSQLVNELTMALGGMAAAPVREAA